MRWSIVFILSLNLFLAQEKNSSVLFEVGKENEKVTARDFFERFLANKQGAAQEVLEELLLKASVQLAAKEHRIVVSQEEVFSQVQKELELCRGQAVKLKLKLSTFLKTKLNMTEGQFVKMAEERARLKLLLGRIIRYEVGLNERVVLRICSLADRATANKVKKEVASGADFTALIREYDVNPYTRRTGGKTRPMSAKDFPPEYEEIKKAAFSLTPNTQLSNVIEVKESNGVTNFALIKVIEKRKAWNRPFNEVKDAITQSLEKSALTPQEINRWRGANKNRWKIKTNIFKTK